ncbi:hypothetical protein BC829DRAFT_261566 [Chytridium lagenaria]|nr:hypothetical protein BC829DRAFT_261566 [Chytridium lagenaria]
MPLNRLDTQDPPILYIYDLSIKNPSSTIPYEALLSLKSCNMPYAHRKWIKDALKSGLDKVLPLMTSPPTIVIAPNHIVGPNHSALAEAINDILPSLPPNSHKDGIGMLVRTREVAQQSLFTKKYGRQFVTHFCDAFKQYCCEGSILREACARG